MPTFVDIIFNKLSSDNDTWHTDHNIKITLSLGDIHSVDKLQPMSLNIIKTVKAIPIFNRACWYRTHFAMWLPPFKYGGIYIKNIAWRKHQTADCVYKMPHMYTYRDVRTPNHADAHTACQLCTLTTSSQ